MGEKDEKKRNSNQDITLAPEKTSQHQANEKDLFSTLYTYTPVQTLLWILLHLCIRPMCIGIGCDDDGRSCCEERKAFVYRRERMLFCAENHSLHISLSIYLSIYLSLYIHLKSVLSLSLQIYISIHVYISIDIYRLTNHT